MTRLYIEIAMQLLALFSAGACTVLTVYNALLYITERDKVMLYFASGHAGMAVMLILLYIGRHG